MTNNQCPLGEHCNQTVEALAWAETILKGIDMIKAQAAEIEMLRGDLAKAVESLGRISDGENWQANEARATLAELTGDKT